MARETPLYYADYLQLDRLLDCQTLESSRRGAPAHDEMLFIIVHQAHELWFKQILWELESVVTCFDGPRVDERDMGRVVAALERIKTIQSLLIEHITVLETMTPLDFLEFRDALIPASGFQSYQFRLLENRLGLPPERRIAFSEKRYTDRLNDEDKGRLEAVEELPSLFDLVDRWLARTPFLQLAEFDFWREYQEAVYAMLDADAAHIENHASLSTAEKTAQGEGIAGARQRFSSVFDEALYAQAVDAGHWRFSHGALQAALLINLYRDEPILHLPFRVLQLLMDIDENMTAWRYRHALMVQRMIGRKIGTGGSSGHDYLRETAQKHQVFADLFALSTFLIPRQRRPQLPADLVEKMGFHFAAVAEQPA